MKNLSLHFGNKKIRKSQKTKLVQEVFSNVSENYDLMNDLMSFGSHRLWKKKLIEIINAQDYEKIIDVGAGTGDIGLKIITEKPLVKIFLGDLNPKMIKIGKKKSLNNKNIKWIKLNAEKLPFPNNYFDKYIISFCLRNITDIKKSLCESFRVLKEGGEFFCMEFSTVNNPIVNSIYNKYISNVIPFLGSFVSDQKNSYEYLAQSIQRFPNQEILKKELIKAGFKKVNYYNLFSGIVAIHKGWKI